MTDDPIDLSLLDPTRDSAAVDRAIASVRARAKAAAGRKARTSPWLANAGPDMATVLQPVIAATLVIAAIAAMALAFVRPSAAPPLLPVWTAADALGIPEQILAWSTTATSPPPLELVSALAHAGSRVTAAGR